MLLRLYPPAEEARKIPDGDEPGIFRPAAGVKMRQF